MKTVQAQMISAFVIALVYVAGYFGLMDRDTPTMDNGTVRFSSSIAYEIPSYLHYEGHLERHLFRRVTFWNYFYYPMDLIFNPVPSTKK